MFGLLLRHLLKRIRVLTITTGLLLAAFQIALIAVARSIHRSGGFDQLSTLIPPFVRALMGPAFTSFMSFSGIVCVGYFELAVIGALIALSISISTIPTSEIEVGFMDLILSRPLARHWIITRTIVALALVACFLLVMMATGTWLGLRMLAPVEAVWPTARQIESLAGNLGFLMLSWSGIAMAIGCASGRRSVAGGVAGLLAFGMYLLDYLGRLWEPADKIAWISPFRYYDPFDLVTGNPLPLKNVAVLIGIAVCGWGAAYVLFSRRDISH